MRRVPTALGVLAILLLFAGCQAMFTTSVGDIVPTVVRTTAPDLSSVTASEAATLLAQPDLPKAVLTNLLSSLNTQVAAGGTTEIKALAAEAALEASAVGDSVTAPMLTVFSAFSSGDIAGPEAVAAMGDIVDALLAGAGTAGVTTGLLRLGDPVVLEATGLSATDKIMSALVLAAAPLNEPAFSAFAADPSTLAGNASKLADYQATPAVQAAADLIASATTDLAADPTSAAIAQMLAAFLPITATP